MTKTLVFLDTSFLIASQVSEHEFLERTVELRKHFIQKDLNPVISLIILDEFWYVLVGLAKKSRRRVSPKEVYSKLRKATKSILSIQELKLLNQDLSKEELLGIVNLMRRFNLRPRDAIIVKLMKKHNIKHIASFDEDFDRVSEISRIY